MTIFAISTIVFLALTGFAFFLLRFKREALAKWALRREGELRAQGLIVDPKRSSLARYIAYGPDKPSAGSVSTNKFGVPTGARASAPRKLSRKQAKAQAPRASNN